MQGSPIPFTTNSFGGTQANPSVSPFFIVAPANTRFGSFNEINNPNGSAARTLQSSLAINGSGPNQSSVLIVSTGSFASNTSGQVVQSGTVRGSFQPNGTIGNQVSLFSGTTSVPDGNGNSLFGGNTLTGFVLDQNQTTTSDNFVEALATAAPRSATSSSQNINYAFTHPAVTTSDPVVGQFGLVPYAPTTRTTQVQAGYFGGTMFPNANPNSAYVLTGVTSLQTDAANNRVGATFTGADPFTASSSGINSAVINFGTATGRPFARAAFIDDKVFAAAESADTPSQINGAALPLPVPTQGNAPRLALVSSATVPIASGTFPGVTFCDCQFLKWGFWTGQLNQVDSSGNTTRVERAFINSWLAGVPTSAADIASLAGANVTGSYSGHAIGSVVNNGSSYLAAGNLAMTYNFASQTGTFNINNFDGRNFTATGSSALSGSNFAGGLTGTGVTGGFAGTFYGPQAANTGGTFSVRSTTATPYLASGIFAGKR